MERMNRRDFLGTAAAEKLTRRYRAPYRHPYQG